MRLAAGLILSALLGFILLGQRSVVALDYRAFYCAGMALRHHEDPYRTASLRDCELRDTDSQYRSRLAGTMLPAPQPLYDIAFFGILSSVPFALAKAVWGALIGMAIFLTAISLVRLTGLSPPLVLAILATSLIGNTLALGQLVPIYAAAAAAAAVLMKENRPYAAGAVAAASLIEPHLGIPLCLSLAVWSRQSRAPLITGAVLLGVVAFAAGGWSVNAEYVTTVLPLHALSELSSDRQFSLSVILHALHVTDAAAIRLGALSSVVMLAAGVWAARIAAVRFENRAFLVTVPAAAAVLGGSFLHGTDIVAAIPLALMLAAVPRFRAVAAIALVLLATPWVAESQPREMIPWFVLSAAVATYIISSIGHLRLPASALCGLLIFVMLCEVNFAYERQQRAYMRSNHAVTVFIDEKYPQAGWARVSARTFATESAPAWLMRAPTWGGLLILLGATGVALRRRPIMVYA